MCLLVPPGRKQRTVHIYIYIYIYPSIFFSLFPIIVIAQILLFVTQLFKFNRSRTPRFFFVFFFIKRDVTYFVSRSSFRRFRDVNNYTLTVVCFLPSSLRRLKVRLILINKNGVYVCVCVCVWAINHAFVVRFPSSARSSVVYSVLPCLALLLCPPPAVPAT